MFFSFGGSDLELNQLLFALADFLPKSLLLALRLLQSRPEMLQLGNALFGTSSGTGGVQAQR